MRALTQKEYIEKVSEVHNHKYKYLNTYYVNSTTKIIVTCPIHGDWETNPRNHLKGCGCPKCVGKGLSTEEWINRFKEVHNSKYDYSKFMYNTIYSKSIITCKKHGDFLQSPHNHSNGQQCPACSREEAWINNTYYNPTNAEKNKEKWSGISSSVYIIKMYNKEETFYKIGITSNNIAKRFRKHDLEYSYEIVSQTFMSLYEAVLLEHKLHIINKSNKYIPVNRFKGYTECFKNVTT